MHGEDNEFGSATKEGKQLWHALLQRGGSEAGERPLSNEHLTQ